MEHLGIVKFDHIWPLVLEILSHLNVANQVSVDISMVMFSIVVRALLVHRSQGSQGSHGSQVT